MAATRLCAGLWLGEGSVAGWGAVRHEVRIAMRLWPSVRDRPGVTAGEIASVTGIARATVSSTVARLAASGTLVRVHLPGSGVGFRMPSAGA